MKRFQDSPTPPRPRVLETDIDYPPRSINGDLNRLPYVGDRCSRGSGAPMGGMGVNISGTNGNKRGSMQEVDTEAEAATPSDTMLSHTSKMPLPDDEYEDDMNRGRTGGRRPLQRGKLSRMAERHGFSRKGLLLLLFFIALSILLMMTLFVMGAMWPKEDNSQAKEICLTPDCLRASAQLQGSLDLSSEPCKDFWNYACGGWLQDNPLPPTRAHWSVTKKLKHQALAEMRSLLDTMDEPEDINSVEWKLRTFYWSCMNVRSYMKNSLQLVKRIIINELQGWNLMPDTWDIRRWDFDYVLRKLHVDYGVSPFFRVAVVADPDPNKEAQNIIKLYPSGFSMPHRSYYDRLPNNDFLRMRLPRFLEKNRTTCYEAKDLEPLKNLQKFLIHMEVEQAYKQYIKDTVKLFDASGPDALDFASHLYHYESRIAEITPPDRVLNDPLASNIKITIGKLSLISTNVPWLELLRQMFPESNLDHRSEVLVASEHYFSNLAKLISTTERSALNSYLIFSFVSAYIPYLSDSNKRVFDLFQSQFQGAEEPVERWEFCIETAAKFFSYGLGSLYERSTARQKARQRNIEQIRDMFYQVRNTLRINLAYSRWYPMETKALLSSKLENMTVEIGYPDRLLDSTVIDHYYKNYNIFTKDFFQNLQDSIRNTREQMERRLLDPASEPPWMEALKLDVVTYVHSSNKVVIPPHILNPPIFHRNYPSCIIYGSLGVKMVREMVRAFDAVGLSYNSRGQLLPRSESTNRTLRHLDNLADCISKTTMSLSIEEDKVVNKTAPDTAAEVDAVRQTYQAYLSLMKREPQTHPPSFESLNTTNIFFMAYAGSTCMDATNQQADIFRTCGDSLMNHPRLLSVLSQLPEFTQVFNCNKDTRHYPHRICASLH